MNVLVKNWRENKIKIFSRMKNKNLRTLMMCEKCYAFYYKNSWHFKRPMYASENEEDEISVLFTQCQACLEQEDSLYEMESRLAVMY